MAFAKHAEFSPISESDANSHNLLLREVNHRASNSLQIANSILTLHARRAASPEARQELQAAAHRVHSIGLVHKRLYQSDAVDKINFGRYLKDLCEEIASCYRDEDSIQLLLNIDDSVAPDLHPDVVLKLGLIVTELLTNCRKHAGAQPVCRVALATQHGKVEITVSDNGPGLPTHFDLDGSTGVGMEVVRVLVSGLQGNLKVVPASVGACFMISVPLNVAVANIR